MSNTSIQLKKSGQTGNIPPSLAHGEVAINYADGKLYYKTASNTISYITNQFSFSTINVGGSLILATTGADTLTLQPGNNISFTTDSLNNKITISSTASSTDQFARDSANSAGSYANAAFIKANAAYNAANSIISVDTANIANVANALTITNPNTGIFYVKFDFLIQDNDFPLTYS